MIIEIPIAALLADNDIPDAELAILGADAGLAALRLNWDDQGLRVAVLCPVFYRKAYLLNEAPRVWAPDEDARRLLYGRPGIESLYLPAAYLPRANLRDCNLARVELACADLSEAQLCGSALSQARLVGASLYKADLSAADLTQADLRGANLIGADLTGANLSVAMLAGAVVTETTVLEGTHFDGADLVGACWMRNDAPPGWDRQGDRLVRPTDRRAGQRCRVCWGVIPLGVKHQCPGSGGGFPAPAVARRVAVSLRRWGQP